MTEREKGIQSSRRTRLFFDSSMLACMLTSLLIGIAFPPAGVATGLTIIGLNCLAITFAIAKSLALDIISLQYPQQQQALTAMPWLNRILTGMSALLNLIVLSLAAVVAIELLMVSSGTLMAGFGMMLFMIGAGVQLLPINGIKALLNLTRIATTPELQESRSQALGRSLMHGLSSVLTPISAFATLFIAISTAEVTVILSPLLVALSMVGLMTLSMNISSTSQALNNATSEIEPPVDEADGAEPELNLAYQYMAAAMPAQQVRVLREVATQTDPQVAPPVASAPSPPAPPQM